MTKRPLTVSSPLALLAAACSAPQLSASAADVPDKLKPAAGESLAMIVPAKGVQIYECRARKAPEGGYEWAFVAPEADLFDSRGAPGAGAIAWLLLGAKSDGPQGSFSRITSAQRVPHTADYYLAKK